MASKPEAVGIADCGLRIADSSADVTLTENRAFSIPSSASAFSTSGKSFFAAAWRFVDSSVPSSVSFFVSGATSWFSVLKSSEAFSSSLIFCSISAR